MLEGHELPRHSLDCFLRYHATEECTQWSETALTRKGKMFDEVLIYAIQLKEEKQSHVKFINSLHPLNVGLLNVTMRMAAE